MPDHHLVNLTRLAKRLHDPAPKWQRLDRHWTVPCLLADQVDRPQQVQQLSANRRIWLERQLVKGHR
jgi:hypothetical protein